MSRSGFLLQNIFGGKTIDHCYYQQTIVSIVLSFALKILGGNSDFGDGKSFRGAPPSTESPKLYNHAISFISG